MNVNYWYSNICILVFQWIWTVNLNSILWTPILSQYYYIYNASYAFRLCAYNWNLSNQISPYTFKKGDHDVHNMYRKYMPYININTDQKVKKNYRKERETMKWCQRLKKSQLLLIHSLPSLNILMRMFFVFLICIKNHFLLLIVED